MSYPKSKTISNISWNDLRFLTDTYTTTIDADNFNPVTGKPLTNMTANSSVDAFFINRLNESLFERVNINDNFINKYPQVLEIDSSRDLDIADEVTLDAIFIFEGASMKNMFGYYFYKVNEDGSKSLLDNDGAIEDYYYKPTIIFPNVTSEPNDSNTLQKGNTRRLKGNLPNGNFSNICVGFFLICYGWYAHITNTDINNDKILHTTTELNHKYITSTYQMVNDLIYSVYFKSEAENGDKLLLVAFEDVFHRGVDDLDYNDCVIGIHASNVNNIRNYNTFAVVEPELSITHNNIIFIDDLGEYVELPDNIYNISTVHDHIFERHINFANNEDRDIYYDIIVDILTNYNFAIEKMNNKIVTKYLFRKNDLLFSKKNNKRQLYLLDSKFNKHKSSIIATYQLILQRNFQNESYVENYKLYQKDDPSVEVIHLTDDIDPPQKVSVDTFRIIGSGTMDCKNGKSHLPFSNRSIYQIYKNVSKTGDGLIINVKMDDHPAGYKLGTKFFVRYISFVVDTNTHVVIDLGNLNIYQEVENVLSAINVNTFNSSQSNINVGNLLQGSDTIKKLASIFRNDSGATYRIITIKNTIKFYCVRLTNVKNNPTLVLADTDFNINWTESMNTLSGTYYNKSKYYVVNSFK
jgi:hypothetical protein